ncbi:MAG TPA: DUF2846 domain-containing protein [Hymenobacter sp.]|uniref:DUF2846 domain-containing protein n=1 Tax=Hymenobacter sp. TaxID=1898978 RepID=UPI002EDB749F
MKNLVRMLAVVLFGALSFAFRPVPPAEETATIYIYRGGQFMGALANYAVYVNDQKICKLSNERYIEYQAKPGKLNIMAKNGGVEVFKKETGLELTVEAGRKYYVRGDIKTSFTRARMELSEVTENTAKRDMEKLTADNCQQAASK